MKTAESAYVATEQPAAFLPARLAYGLGCSKIGASHFKKLAIVYVRQSSPMQMLENRESTGHKLVDDERLKTNEWWVADLSRRLNIRHQKLHNWAERGWVRSRRTRCRGFWILWADDDEIDLLRRLAIESRRGVNAYASELTTPKPLNHASAR